MTIRKAIIKTTVIKGIVTPTVVKGVVRPNITKGIVKPTVIKGVVKPVQVRKHVVCKQGPPGPGGGGDIKSDGSVPFAADQSMGNNHLTNLPPGTDPGHAVVVGQGLDAADLQFAPDETGIEEGSNEVVQDIYSSDSRKTRVNCVGDSQSDADDLAARPARQHDDFYPFVLQESDRDNSAYYIEQGVSGDTSADILARYDTSIGDFFKRDAGNKLFIQVGANDALASRSATDYYTDVNDIITQAVSDGYDVYVATVTPFDQTLYDAIHGGGAGAALNVFVDSYNTQINANAVADGATIIDLSTFVSADGDDWDDETWILTDGLHWSPIGHQNIAGVIREYVHPTYPDNTIARNNTGYPDFGNQLIVSGDDSFQTSITIDAGAKTFTRGSGSFIDEGWKTGDVFLPKAGDFTGDFTNSVNNVEHRIVDVKPLVLTVSTSTLVSETATVTLVNKKIKPQAKTALTEDQLQLEANEFRLGFLNTGTPHTTLRFGLYQDVNTQVGLYGFENLLGGQFFRTFSGFGDLYFQQVNSSDEIVLQVGGASAKGGADDRMTISDTAITADNGVPFVGPLTGNAATATTATNQSGGTVNATTGDFSNIVEILGGLLLNNGLSNGLFIPNSTSTIVGSIFEDGGIPFLQGTGAPKNINTLISDSHPQSHTIISHSDTNATGSELDSLTDDSSIIDASLHNHHVFAEFFRNSTQDVNTTAQFSFTTASQSDSAFSVSTGSGSSPAGSIDVNTAGRYKVTDLSLTGTNGVANTFCFFDIWLNGTGGTRIGRLGNSAVMQNGFDDTFSGASRWVDLVPGDYILVNTLAVSGSFVIRAGSEFNRITIERWK